MTGAAATFEDVLILAAICLILAVPVFFIMRAERRLRERMKRLRPRGTVFDENTSIRITHPSTPHNKWTRALVFVTNKSIVAYPVKGDDTPLFECHGHEIEGFWRPKKYEEGLNFIEIHANAAGQWTILKLHLYKSRMEALVRALKTLVADDDIVRAYRQRRPYIYRPVADAHPAQQDLYGMWEHGSPHRVYLTPRTLVLLQADDHVERVIPLRDVRDVRALKEAHGDGADGLVAFTLASTGEEVAVAVKEYEAWAQSIARAARCTLEEPAERKRKGKVYDESLDEDLDWEGGDFDMAVWEKQEYVLGDDGELHPRAAAGG